MEQAQLILQLNRNLTRQREIEIEIESGVPSYSFNSTLSSNESSSYLASVMDDNTQPPGLTESFPTINMSDLSSPTSSNTSIHFSNHCSENVRERKHFCVCKKGEGRYKKDALMIDAAFQRPLELNSSSL